MEISESSLYIASTTLSIVCLVYTLLQGRTDKRHNKLFIALLGIVIIGSFTDGTAYVLKPLLSMGGAVAGVYVTANYLYFIFHSALAMLFLFYVLEVSGLSKRGSRAQNFILWAPGIVCIVMSAINPLTNWVYTYGDPLSFIRCWGVYVIYAVSAIYLLVGIVVLMRFWSAITPRKRSSLLFFIVLVVAGTVIQLVFPGVRAELFCESLALLGVMLTIEDESDRIDAETGIYDRRALNLDLANLISTGNRFDVVHASIVNTELVLRTSGFAAYSDLMIVVTEWMMTIVPRYRIYRSAPNSFTILRVGSDADDSAAVASAIADRFASPWQSNETEFILQCSVMRASVPDEFSTVDDVLFMVDSPAPNSAGRVLSGSDLDFLRRRAAVELAVVRGLEQSNFEMHYQPLCDADGRPCGAEALMRLNDPVLGSVPPFEFIDVAERTGVIDELGDFALEETCRFIESGEPAALGIDVIHVNLSALQCMQPGAAERLRGIVAEHGVNPHRIDFEITESVAAAHLSPVISLMRDLRADGFTFSMDDYGTGYSNMRALLDLDFDTVKIDKSIVWGAEKDDAGRAILENTMRMLQQTGHMTVAEGVETEEQIELLGSFGIDFLQGFHYSRPLPREEFCAWVRTNR